MESKPLQRGPVIVGVALLCTLLWGTAYPAVKIGYELFAIDTSARAAVICRIALYSGGFDDAGGQCGAAKNDW